MAGVKIGGPIVDAFGMEWKCDMSDIGAYTNALGNRIDRHGNVYFYSILEDGRTDVVKRIKREPLAKYEFTASCLFQRVYVTRLGKTESVTLLYAALKYALGHITLLWSDLNEARHGILSCPTIHIGLRQTDISDFVPKSYYMSLFKEVDNSILTLFSGCTPDPTLTFIDSIEDDYMAFHRQSLVRLLGDKSMQRLAPLGTVTNHLNASTKDINLSSHSYGGKDVLIVGKGLKSITLDNHNVHNLTVVAPNIGSIIVDDVTNLCITFIGLTLADKVEINSKRDIKDIKMTEVYDDLLGPTTVVVLMKDDLQLTGE